jgi:nickel transport protein
MIPAYRFLVVLLWLPMGLTWAHEVQHTVETPHVVAIHLTYADGSPFAFEAFEAYPEGKDVPAQVGRTDAQGRALFVPGEYPRWRVKAFSADGHGVDIKIDAPTTANEAAAAKATADVADDSLAGPNRASRLLFGLSLLLAGFGLYQLFSRKRA